MASENADFRVECVTGARSAVLHGVLRLEHGAAFERVFAPINADFQATGAGAYTIDVSRVVFMNSSAIRALASLVMEAKRAGRRLSIIGDRSVPWQDRTLASLAALYDGLELRLSTSSNAPTLRREQELWAIETAEGRTLRFKDSKGFEYLEMLLCQPGRELHVLEIAGVDSGGDSGPVLDERAKTQYRERVADLRRELTEAERFNDLDRATRVRAEMDAIAEELAAAVGPSGRDRRIAPNVQRARINVQRCLKDALERITNADPSVGRYFAATIKTGTYCSFKPL